MTASGPFSPHHFQAGDLLRTRISAPAWAFILGAFAAGAEMGMGGTPRPVVTRLFVHAGISRIVVL